MLQNNIRTWQLWRGNLYDADSKIQITFDNGNILTGNIERVEYGTYPDENDTLVIRAENGEFYILLGNRIKDIEELNE